MQATNNPPPSTPSFQIPDYVLDDLCSRFIINIPEEERQDLIRIFFQIELAHWFYLDFYCAENPELKTCGIKDFSAQIFHHCPSLSGHVKEVDMILGNWKSYKMSVPTYGAILLDPEMKYCLLVQGFWAKASWGFPKGKVNASEPPHECAIREVYEETGFDVAKQMNKDEFLDNKMNDRMTRLYIIRDVPLDTKFQPKTRKEIKNLQWFPLDALPAHKRDQTPKNQLGLNPNTFFMVIPFVKPLRKWVSTQINKQSYSMSSSTSSTAASTAVGATDRQKSATNKDVVDAQNNKQQFKEKQRQRQQQYFAASNQKEFQEFMHIKETKGRSKDVRDRNVKAGALTQSANQAGAPVAQGFTSPGFKQRQQYHILNRDGTVNGKPRRSLATQFENQEAPPSPSQYQQRGSKYNSNNKYDRRQKGADTRSDIFIPQAWANFRFDVDAIMAVVG